MGTRNKKPATGRAGNRHRHVLAPAATRVIAAGAFFAVAQLLSAFFGATSSP